MKSSLASDSLFRGDQRPMWKSRRLSDLSKRGRERRNGNRDEKRRKRSNLVGPPGDSTGEFYNEVRSGAVGSRFSNRQSARGKPSGNTLRTGSPQGEAESTSMRRPNFFLRWQGAIALSHDCGHSFFLLTLFLTDKKCNRAHDSEVA